MLLASRGDQVSFYTTVGGDVFLKDKLETHIIATGLGSVLDSCYWFPT